MKHRLQRLYVAGYVVIFAIAGLAISRTYGLYQSFTVLITGILLLTTTRHFQLSTEELGLQKKNLRSGFLWSLPFIALIVAGALTALLINPGFFQDQRYQQSFSSVVLMIAVIIPLRTVLLEELIFRGTLLAVLRRRIRSGYAITTSSILFGLWHIFSAGSIRNQALESSGTIATYGAVVGVIFVTFCAGIVFSWLRIKSKSLLAPMLVHWAINSTGVLFAYVAWL